MSRPADIRSLLATGCCATVLLGAGAGAAAAVNVPSSPPAPKNTSAPVIRGSLVQGAVLTADPGRWTGTPAPTFTYRWLRCQTSCAPIPGATMRTYRLTAPDVSRRVRVQVTGTNMFGRATAASARSALVRSAFRVPAANEKSPRPGRLRSRIVIKGRLTDLGARFTSVALRASRGARVAIRCRGEDCPYKRASRRLRVRRIRLRSLERPLGAGTVVELRITKPELVGRFTRIRIRRDRTPRRLDRCLKPGAKKPSRCR